MRSRFAKTRLNIVMRPLRYSINVTLDGCCDHRVGSPDEELHRHAVENLNQADALLFGRATYEMMEAAFRPAARTGARPDWMEPYSGMRIAKVWNTARGTAQGRRASRARCAVRSRGRQSINAELVRGDLGKAVQQLKQALARL